MLPGHLIIASFNTDNGYALRKRSRQPSTYHLQPPYSAIQFKSTTGASSNHQTAGRSQPSSHQQRLSVPLVVAVDTASEGGYADKRRKFPESDETVVPGRQQGVIGIHADVSARIRPYRQPTPRRRTPLNSRTLKTCLQISQCSPTSRQLSRVGSLQLYQRKIQKMPSDESLNSRRPVQKP